LNLEIPILALRDVTKTFPGITVLQNVNFELRRGEVHILLGENGAGKSTLAKIISGACQKSAGAILLDGQPVEIKSPRHSRELGVGMIYQELNLAPNLTVAENIYLGREPTLIPGVIDRKGIERAAQKVLESLGVEIPVHRRLGELGIAQQQMVEVAKALSLNARILIMDEPTSALTATEIKELFAAIRRMKAKGVAIIYISHRLEELLEIGDRVTVLRDGHSVATQSIREVTMAELIRLMVNRELKEQFPKKRVPRGSELLRVERLNKTGFLRNINFSVHRGEVLGIAGLLGSGRSRLARSLFGAERVDSGELFFKGRRCKITSPKCAIELGIGYLAEDRRTDGLVLKLAVGANICLSSMDKLCTYGLLRVRREKKTAAGFIQQLLIKTQGVDQPVMFLSGGNQQKVVLSKWLCSKAELFIFDEPTRGIDVGAKVEIYQLINELTANGAAVIMISSELPEVLGMSDRILTMCRGAISAEFSAGDATQEKLLQGALGLN
jgi:ribose transport system ATP-binding protein